MGMRNIEKEGVFTAVLSLVTFPVSPQTVGADVVVLVMTERSVSRNMYYGLGSLYFKSQLNHDRPK